MVHALIVGSEEDARAAYEADLAFQVEKSLKKWRQIRELLGVLTDEQRQKIVEQKKAAAEKANAKAKVARGVARKQVEGRLGEIGKQRKAKKPRERSWLRGRVSEREIITRPKIDFRTWPQQRMITNFDLLLLPLVCAEIVLEADFDALAPNQPPAGWDSFRSETRPAVAGFSGALKGGRSTDKGLVALSRWFDAPRQNLAIEFSFAVSAGAGRVFHVWTQEPNGDDASQFNLCVQGGKLQQFDGRTRSWETIPGKIQPSSDPAKPVWHRLRAVMNAKSRGIDIFLSKPGSRDLTNQPSTTVAAYRTDLPFGGFSLVSGTRIAPGAWYLLDDLVIRSGAEIAPPGKVEPLAQTYELWTGPPLPSDPEQIPFAEGIEHRVIHRPDADGYKFLHGAAILEHDGVFYANWANSPVHENGPRETLQGRRSADGGLTWSAPEIIGPGFDGAERHSHGVLFVHEGEIWTICARFGVGTGGKRFTGLQGEAFVLNRQSDRWESRGIVMKNCWPYDQIVPMDDGSFITGGQDKDGLPVVAISRGGDLRKWDSILIPYHRRLAPSFAETTVWAKGPSVLAVIRGGGGVAWVARSEDFGKNWQTARPSNLPMPRAKAYLDKLSTGQLYLVSNYRNRDTLAISTGKPGELSLSRMWRLRHGRSKPPRFPGNAKSPQWSYPYAYEHAGRLYVVYSIGKEECGLTVIPVTSLGNP